MYRELQTLTTLLGEVDVGKERSEGAWTAFVPLWPWDLAVRSRSQKQSKSTCGGYDSLPGHTSGVVYLLLLYVGQLDLSCWRSRRHYHKY